MWAQDLFGMRLPHGVAAPLTKNMGVIAPCRLVLVEQLRTTLQGMDTDTALIRR